MASLQALYPRIARQVRRPLGTFGRIGDHTIFYGRAIAGTPPHATIHFRKEIIRLIAEISMGAGTLAMIGGTVVIVGFLTLAAGGTLAVQGYSSLGNIGIEALTGFLAAFINVRISAPVVAGIGLAATFGAGVTAQLGAMRINEEIDALESMGIPPRRIPRQYPHRGRHGRHHPPAVLHRRHPVLCGLPIHHRRVVRPIRRPVRPLLQHLPQPHRPPLELPASRVDGHHDPVDPHLLRLLRHRRTLWSRVAVGNAVRTSLIVVVSVTLLVSLAIYGSNGNFNLSG